MSKLYRLLTIGICAAILFIACDRPQDNLSVVNSESCRLVEHDAGKTEICGRTQTVVALSPRALDVMLALNIQPAAYAEELIQIEKSSISIALIIPVNKFLISAIV